MRDQQSSRAAWRVDFPVDWEDDQYVTRREFAKFLALGSVILGVANGLLAVWGRKMLAHRAKGFPRQRIMAASALKPGDTKLFRFPTHEDPAILVRTPEGKLRAYSQVCTHLSCAVVYLPEKRGFMCPCHRGWFAVEDGRPTAGPPTRRLPRILLEEEGGDIFAIAEKT